MTNTTYNGWTNYATWRIALEWFDSYNPFEYERDVYNLSKMIKEYVSESLENMCDNANVNIYNNYALDYAFAFLQDVNWYEIAENIIREEVQDEN